MVAMKQKPTHRILPMLASSCIAFTILVSTASFATNTTNMALVIPPTADAIIEAMDEEVVELDNIIKSNLLHEVQHHANVIRDLANGLLTHPEALPPNDLPALKTDVKYVNTMAQRLDTSVRANNKAGTTEDFIKLQKVLASIRERYSMAAP
jgi:hypothetical protein